MKILFTIAEAYPFVKVGGLADVGGGLPKILARLGHDVRLVLPGYPSLEGLAAGRSVRELTVPMGPREERAEVHHHGAYGDVEVYTIRNARYFGEGVVYGGYGHGDVVPFTFFSKAVVHLAADPDWRPDVVHSNDWHTGLVSSYARGGPEREALARTGFVFSIHNLAYQGHLDPETEMLAGPWGGMEADLEPTLLARGILTADVVNTVSQSYLEEILTPEGGMGMDGVLRERRDDLYGVLNGVDYEEFDPCLDPYIAAGYDESSFVEGKKKNKAALQEMSGLEGDPDAPLLGMVARLVEQKGVDILCAALDQIDALGAQVVVMGTGEKIYELALIGATCTMKNVRYHPVSDEDLARQVYAGSDLFLAPSTFEPCGLGPLIALRYASVPLVRHTGGLRDTIPDYEQDPENALGFTYVRQESECLVEAVGTALQVYRREDEWRDLQHRTMAADFSWERAARRYEDLYRKAVSAARDGSAKITAGSRPERRLESGQAMPLALVHHANQYLITDGYLDREGISEIVEGYARTLRLHEKYRVPTSLHLSGTLVEAAAWHAPWFLEMVRKLKESGLVSLIGGTYSENIMPLFSAGYNRRQLEEAFWLYERHLGVHPEELKVCWVPERVWDTHKLAPILADASLPNGGYHHVLLDDRLLFPVEGHYPSSPRARFDAAMPYRGADGETGLLPEACKTVGISGSGGLTMAPISSLLRYRIPPSSREDLRRLQSMVGSFGAGEPGSILVYGDDLERTAGVGGWEKSAPIRYEVFLRWLAQNAGGVEAVHLPDWLAANPPREDREIEPGAFYELDRGWEAGEDYRGWWEDEAYAPSKQHLEEALGAVEEAEREGADGRLLGLAWKHLLASGYETAWHDPGNHGDPVPAAWSKTVASHARSSLVIADAARWFADDR